LTACAFKEGFFIVEPDHSFIETALIKIARLRAVLAFQFFEQGFG
jgi:hypothetical protein